MARDRLSGLVTGGYGSAEYARLLCQFQVAYAESEVDRGGTPALSDQASHNAPHDGSITSGAQVLHLLYGSAIACLRDVLHCPATRSLAGIQRIKLLLRAGARDPRKIQRHHKST